MADYVALRTAIDLAKDKLKVLNTQLTTMSTTALSTGATYDASGTLVARVNTIRDLFVAVSKEVADINASLIS